MSDLADFLRRLAAVLDGAGVPYMIAGSVASTFHGSPRTTQDVDLVVELGGRGLREMLARLPDDQYYVSAEAARDAVRGFGQFNVIDFSSGWKADLIVRKDRPFSEEEFHRRIRGTLLGVDMWVASAEDTILSKLEWAGKSGGSERQMNDVRGILAARGADLDRAYIERWAARLGVGDTWQQVSRAAPG